MACRSHVESGLNSPLRAADLYTPRLWTFCRLWMIGAQTVESDGPFVAKVR